MEFSQSGEILMIRIFSVVIPARVFALFLSEIVLLTGCYLIAALLDADLGSLSMFLEYEFGVLRFSIVIGLLVAGLYFRNLYVHVRVMNRVVLIQELCMVFGMAMVGQGLINYLNKDLTLPRRVMVGGSILALMADFGWRLIFDSLDRQTGPGGRVLFLGVSPTTAELAGHLQSNPELGLVPVGYLEEGNASPDSETHMTRLGRLAALDEAIEASRPNLILIGRSNVIRPWWTNDFLELRFGGVAADEVAALYEKTLGRMSLREIRPAALIFSSAFEAPPLDRNLQRFYSAAIASAVFLLVLPPGMLIWLWILLTSGRPVFEKQRLIGFRGAPFHRWRFRSRKNDFLDRSGLADLPGLWNVLRGDMAIAGPRPDRPEAARFLTAQIPFYSQRQCVRPGITGWAQVHGSAAASDSLLELEYDLYYVRNLSPSLDLVVFLIWLRQLFSLRPVRA